MHGKRLCTCVTLPLLIHACCFAVHVSVYVSVGTQQGASGASEGKWVFLKKKAQIGTLNIPSGREGRSILAHCTHTHTQRETERELDAQLLCCY